MNLLRKTGSITLAASMLFLASLNQPAFAAEPVNCNVPTDGAVAFVNSNIANGTCQTFIFNQPATRLDQTIKVANKTNPIKFVINPDATLYFGSADPAQRSTGTGLYIGPGVTFELENNNVVKFENIQGFGLSYKADSNVTLTGTVANTATPPADKGYWFRNVTNYNLESQGSSNSTLTVKDAYLDVATNADNVESPMIFGGGTVNFTHSVVNVDSGGGTKAVSASNVAVWSTGALININGGTKFTSKSNWYYNFNSFAGLNIEGTAPVDCDTPASGPGGENTEVTLITKADAITTKKRWFLELPHPVIGLKVGNSAANVTNGATLNIIDNVPADPKRLRHGVELYSATTNASLNADGAIVNTPSIDEDNTGSSSSLYSTVNVSNAGQFNLSGTPTGEVTVPNPDRVKFYNNGGNYTFANVDTAAIKVLDQDGQETKPTTKSDAAATYSSCIKRLEVPVKPEPLDPCGEDNATWPALDALPTPAPEGEKPEDYPVTWELVDKEDGQHLVAKAPQGYTFESGTEIDFGLAPDSGKQCVVLEKPEAPIAEDPCGEDNATWPSLDVLPVVENATWSLTEDGHLVLTANEGFTFEDGDTVDYGLPVDSGELCPPTVLDSPQAPTPVDPCGKDNATWPNLADLPVVEHATWAVTEDGHLTLTAEEGFTFADGQVIDYGLPTDSGELCPPEVLTQPAAPSPVDPCGDDNATWPPLDALPVVEHATWALTEDGHLTLTADEGFTFEDGAVIDYGLPTDSGKPCPPKVIAKPDTPSVIDPCGKDNATWPKIADLPAIEGATWSLTSTGDLHLTALDGYTFGDTLVVDYGKPVDSGKLCPTPPVEKPSDPDPVKPPVIDPTQPVVPEPSTPPVTKPVDKTPAPTPSVSVPDPEKESVAVDQTLAETGSVATLATLLTLAFIGLGGAMVLIARRRNQQG